MNETIQAVIEKLRSPIESEFPGARVDLRRYSPGTRVGGMVVWSGFGGMDQLDRQHLLRDVIDATLDHDERCRVTMVLTMAPEELPDSDDIDF